MKTSHKQQIFNISQVPIDPTPVESIDGEELLKTCGINKIEASSINPNKNYVNYNVGKNKLNHFMLMLNLAFNNHKPVVVTPDNLWLLICQGFSYHIKLNSEYFRKKLVDFEGKETISIIRNDFIKGDNNPWEEVFPEFGKKTSSYLKEDLHSKLVLKFTTTSIKEATAFEISFMDSLSSYFEYTMFTLCGIPKIHLKGTAQDYEKMISSLAFLSKFDLEWWTKPLTVILNKIKSTLEGDFDQNFWKSFFKIDDMSGGPYINGWIGFFFPYMIHTDFDNPTETSISKNRMVEENKFEIFAYKINHFPTGISSTPFNWEYLGHKLKMRFISGLIGTTENKESNFLETEINWIIEEK